MRKITFLFLLVSVLGFSQKKLKAYEQETVAVSFDQYDLIKKVNEYYPDIFVSKSITNNYTNDLKERVLVESYLVYEMPLNCTSYSVLVYPDNTRLDYSYNRKDKGFFYGNVTIFNGSVYRTVFNINGDNRYSSYYIDGKLINEVKI
ncbi:hypothetical protein [Flavobacterium sp. M31R6]|uniref:hypothetical protein n=1 Tax=Flavobacterium sp. M31R6 TaxID=2739062 RepID=UPI0015691B12|nr:hypothetical protein [Flavobacterium sp. M31R6]QKJ63837.1 hypothetical protein HQN62_12085 [Flavobacterium sp. M31R6]